MQTILIIIAVALGGYYIYKTILKNEDDYLHNTQRPDVPLPTKPVENDKLVLVRNVPKETLEKILQEFCNLYNQGNYDYLPRLSITEAEYWIRLPYDNSFEQFCYFVNYLKYPCEIENHTPQILAWCTPKQGETWVTEEIAHKKVMLFIPDFDDEYDNVYLTTEDNIGYKMGFGSGHECIRLEKPVNPFADLTEDFGKKTIIKEIDFK